MLFPLLEFIEPGIASTTRGNRIRGRWLGFASADSRTYFSRVQKKRERQRGREGGGRCGGFFLFINVNVIVALDIKRARRSCPGGRFGGKDAESMNKTKGKRSEIIHNRAHSVLALREIVRSSRLLCHFHATRIVYRNNTLRKKFDGRASSGESTTGQFRSPYDSVIVSFSSHASHSVNCIRDG